MNEDDEVLRALDEIERILDNPAETLAGAFAGDKPQLDSRRAAFASSFGAASPAFGAASPAFGAASPAFGAVHSPGAGPGVRGSELPRPLEALPMFAQHAEDSSELAVASQGGFQPRRRRHREPPPPLGAVAPARCSTLAYFERFERLEGS